MNTLILEQNEMEETAVDVYQKLANGRILFISDYIDDKVSVDIIATMLLKDAEDSSSKISLFLNSEGGDIRNVFMIYDVMNLIKSPIETVCFGSVMDESVVLLAAGTPGMRYATANSVISPSHLVYSGVHYSDLTNAKITLDQIKHDNKKQIEALSKCTGKTFKTISSDLDKKNFFTPKQAVKYGLIDGIVRLAK